MGPFIQFDACLLPTQAHSLFYLGNYLGSLGPQNKLTFQNLSLGFAVSCLFGHVNAKVSAFKHQEFDPPCKGLGDLDNES